MDTTTIETEWQQSDQINEIAAALAKAQAKIKNAKKSSDNPFFKSKYADLAEVSDACKGPLSENGIAVMQGPLSRDKRVGVRTMLAHSSGQWVACTMLATPKDDGPQAVGSVVTYLRRYTLASMTGVATEDDDGEKAQGRDRDAKPPGASWGPKSAPKPANRQTDASQGLKGDNSDTGEVLDAGQLVELTEAFGDKWGKGAKTAAPSWLKAQFGTDNPASLTKVQATEALQKLLAS